jgi:hypothetical protein
MQIYIHPAARTSDLQQKNKLIVGIVIGRDSKGKDGGWGYSVYDRSSLGCCWVFALDGMVASRHTQKYAYSA